MIWRNILLVRDNFSKNLLPPKNISSNQLFSDFFRKNVTLTKFLPKPCETKTRQFPHCVIVIWQIFSLVLLIFREITHFETNWCKILILLEIRQKIQHKHIIIYISGYKSNWDPIPQKGVRAIPETIFGKAVPWS